jgi:hypothetical protein
VAKIKAQSTAHQRKEDRHREQSASLGAAEKYAIRAGMIPSTR